MIRTSTVIRRYAASVPEATRTAIRAFSTHENKLPRFEDASSLAPPLKSALEYSWNQGTMSQTLRKMQYAVRGEVVIEAEKLAAAGKEIIYTNIGNPQVRSVVDERCTTYRGMQIFSNTFPLV